MSIETEKELFKYSHTVGLVTTASFINNNLALLLNEDYIKADSVVVAHEGYLNYIPLVNTFRRSKYVPICAGCDRGKGIVKTMSWIKLANETYFLCLSTIGVQLFDVELTDIQFEYDFKDVNSRLSIPMGFCVTGDLLLVGTALGIILMFRQVGDCVQMVNSVKLQQYLNLDGHGNNVIIIGREEIGSYELMSNKIEQKTTYKETNLSSVSKLFEDTLIIGYHTGEITLLSVPDLKLLVKTQAHQQEITALDYAKTKRIVITTSMDRNVKVWQYDVDKRSLNCVYKVKSDDKPCCGIGFIDRDGSEFCTVRGNSLRLDFYVDTTDQGEADDLDPEEKDDSPIYYDGRFI